MNFKTFIFMILTFRRVDPITTIKESKWERKFETVDVLNKKEKQ